MEHLAAAAASAAAAAAAAADAADAAATPATLAGSGFRQRYCRAFGQLSPVGPSAPVQQRHRHLGLAACEEEARRLVASEGAIADRSNGQKQWPPMLAAKTQPRFESSEI